MEIKNFRKNEKVSALKCIFTVYIPEWGHQEIDCAYFEKDNGSYWINFAAKEYINKEGKKKSFNQTRWPQHVSEKLTKAIHEKLMTMLNGPEPETQLPNNEEELPF